MRSEKRHENIHEPALVRADARHGRRLALRHGDVVGGDGHVPGERRVAPARRGGHERVLERHDAVARFRDPVEGRLVFGVRRDCVEINQ